MKLRNIIITILAFTLISCGAEEFITPEVTFDPDKPIEVTTQTEINLAAGKFYTTNVTAHSSLPDQYPVAPWSTGSKLTDEEIGSGSQKNLVVGWEGQTVEVVIDLGTLRKIKEVSVHAISDRLYSIKFPSQISIAYSKSKSSWTNIPQVGTFLTKNEPSEDSWAAISFEQQVDCRYVKVTLVPALGDKSTIAIDEIKVIGEYKTDPKYVPKTGAYHGAFTPIGAWALDEREGVTGNGVTLFEPMVDKQISIMLWYQQMTPGRNFAEMINARNDFWGRDFNGKHRIFIYGWLAQTKAEPIAQGSLDEYFKSYFEEVAEAQKNPEMEPIWFRPMNEMNGAWTPYSRDTKNYVRAWRRMYNIAEQLGVTNYNVFVWSPSSFNSPNTADNQMRDYYPGDIYVDWLGVSLYPPSLSAVFPEDSRYPLTHMREFQTVSSEKPVMISEGGYSGTCDRIRWVQEWFQIKTVYPRVKAVIWENHNGNPDVEGFDRRLQSDPAALKLYKELVKDPYWLDAIPAEIYQEYDGRRQ